MSSDLLTHSATRRDSAQQLVSDTELSSLVLAVLKLAQASHIVLEESQVRRLLTELIQSDPGTIQQSWWRWLLSAARSLNVNWRVADIVPADLPALLRTGTGVAFESSAARLLSVDVPTAQSAHVAVIESSAPTDAASDRPALLRLVVAQPESDHGSAHAEHDQPWVVLWKLLSPDRKDILTVAAISGVAGLLMLSVPVTAQHLVRTVTFATLYQPIIVLTLLLLGLLGFVAALQALQVYVAEIIQRRLFVRVAAKVSRRLIHADLAAWHSIAMPELVNRFLEVAIVQKVTASLLVDGIATALTTLIGMSVMAFYHPFLLGYDIMLLALLALIFFVFGRGAVKTAILESRAKYGVLGWLEDIARCPGVFRTSGVELLALQRTDRLCAEYLQLRSSHFSILMRQIVLVLILQAIATTTLLGLGGLLVLNEQLTLGQLVAAELIVTMIVASFAKLGKHLEGWYDLVAGVDKLSHLLDLPHEPHAGLAGLPRNGAAEVTIHLRPEISGQFPNVRSAEVKIAAGTSAALLNWPPNLTRMLAEVFRGAHDAKSLSLMIDGVSSQDIRPDVLRSHAAVVTPGEFLMGTVAENIHLARPNISELDVLQASEAVGLLASLEAAGFGITTQILPSGYPLDTAHCHRLILARGLADHPRALYIDGALDALSLNQAVEVWQGLRRHCPNTTLILATVRSELAALADKAIEPDVLSSVRTS